jgi:Domain of unknown function (DUF4919)
MRKALILLACLLAAGLPARAADVPQTPSPALYKALVAEVQGGKTDIDYTLLRQSYATTDDYDYAGFGFRGAYQAALQASADNDCPTVLKKTDDVLAIDFTHMLTHGLRGSCFQRMGDGTQATYEAAIARGLRDSVMSSGDGKSAQTAFVVFTLSEEHMVLIANRCQEQQQALLHDGGHSYDMLTCQTEAGETMQFYFQIDAIWAAEGRMFAGPKKS